MNNRPIATGSHNGYEYVDLGLSVKWATCNVGADTPEEYGLWYPWGEVNNRGNFDWVSYKFYLYSRGSCHTVSKYIRDSEHGTVDNRTILDLEDDVAHINWGCNWRMPTSAEIDELCDNCTSKWTSLDGVPGCRFTSNKPGYTDRFIFLPAAGFRDDLNDSKYVKVGSLGLYWSNTLYYGGKGYCLALDHFGAGWDYHERYCGLTVRPVCL